MFKLTYNEPQLNTKTNRMKKIYLCLLFNLSITLGINAQIKYVTESGGSQGNDGASWDTAYDKSKLQQAINEAETLGEQVWVAKGVYRPTFNLTGTADVDKSFVLRNGVKIYGGFAGNITDNLANRDFSTNETILSGDFEGGVSAHHVVVNIANVSGVVLDGFTITGGSATGSTAGITPGTFAIQRNRGGGIYIDASDDTNKAIDTEVELKNLKIVNNKAFHGGAIYKNRFVSTAVVNVRLLSSFLSDNEGTATATGTGNGGGSIFQTGGTMDIENTTIQNSKSGTNGGAIYNQNFGVFNIKKTKFLNNVSNQSAGTIHILTGTVNVSNSVFFGNEGKLAVIITGSNSGKGTLNAVNNTFYQNRFTDAAPRGVIAFQNTNYGEANLHNNIFRDNKDASNFLYDLERVVPTNTVILDLKNNLFETAYTGVATKVFVENNYTYQPLLPLFASTTQADFNFLHLVEGQATERGNNSLATTAGLLVGVDLFGNNRLLHANIDLGAYEYQGVLPVQFDYFKVAKAGNDANLTWRTISETDNSHFIIERGASPAQFTELTRKTGAGTTSLPTAYRFVDQNPLNGINYYRLTQYDKNGDSKILGVQALTFSLNAAQTLVYPNPAAHQVFVKLADAKGKVTIDLVSLTGQNLWSKTYNVSGEEEIPIDLADVPKGSYVLWINKGKNNYGNKKLLVVK